MNMETITVRPQPFSRMCLTASRCSRAPNHLLEKAAGTKKAEIPTHRGFGLYFLVLPGRFELPAPGLGILCSILLSYGSIFFSTCGAFFTDR